MRERSPRIPPGRPEFPIELRRLRATDWRKLRELRLAALREDPLAFGGTYDQEIAFPDRRWQTRCRSAATGRAACTMVAEDSSGAWWGMAGLFADQGVYHVVAMWVRPQARGQGFGGRLLDALLAWAARTAGPTAVVVLEVNPIQLAAIRTYRSRGFRFTGASRPLGHHPPAIVRQMRRLAVASHRSKNRSPKGA